MLNFKVRFKNPVFWLTMIPAIFATVYSVLGIFGIVPSVSEDTIVNMFIAIITILTNIGVLVDPTTAGVSDSAQALTYDTPKED